MQIRQIVVAAMPARAERLRAVACRHKRPELVPVRSNAPFLPRGARPGHLSTHSLAGPARETPPEGRSCTGIRQKPSSADGGGVGLRDQEGVAAIQPSPAGWHRFMGRGVGKTEEKTSAWSAGTLSIPAGDISRGHPAEFRQKCSTACTLEIGAFGPPDAVDNHRIEATAMESPDEGPSCNRTEVEGPQIQEGPLPSGRGQSSARSGYRP
jgi:hypothetical protein